MIVGFNGKVARDIWESNSSKTLPREVWLRAKALLTIMHSTRTLKDLRIRGESLPIYDYTNSRVIAEGIGVLPSNCRGVLRFAMAMENFPK
jgi:hypothetical protein